MTKKNFASGKKSPEKHKVEEEIYPVALTVAGSDSGGGAGIEADLRTFNALGVFGCAVITAVTAQNPLEVRRIDSIPADGVRIQLEAVLDKIAVSSVKSGMLFNSEIVEVVAETLKKRHLPLVCDPVMVSTSGSALLQADAVKTVIEKLIPVAAWITPNIPEAELLTGKKISTMADAAASARYCYDKWGVSVLLKTGHAVFDEKYACDIVFHHERCFELRSPRCNFKPYASHGTGCTLSSALAACFALKYPVEEALREAKAFVLGSLRESIAIGNGINGMYPPTQDSYDETVLIPVKY